MDGKEKNRASQMWFVMRAIPTELNILFLIKGKSLTLNGNSMSLADKFIQWFNRMIKEQYDVTIYLQDGKKFPNGRAHIMVSLKKIKKINNKYLSGTDINGQTYEFSSVEDFNYEVKKVY